MTHLVNLEVAKGNLHVTDDFDDENLTNLLHKASAIVLDYLKVALDTYDDAEAPEIVQAATLQVLRALYDDPESDPITPAVVSILHRSRDPALA